MPAEQRYPAPHEQLCVLAIDARRNSIDFEEFWARAVRPTRSPLITTETPNPPSEAVVWPRDSSDRANAISAIVATKEGWRRAYERGPDLPQDRAINVLRMILWEGGGAATLGGSKEGSGVVLAAAR